MNENMKTLKETNTVINLVTEIQNGNIMMALAEIDQILLDTEASVWLKERALSQREAAMATYKNICFETAHADLLRKDGEK